MNLLNLDINRISISSICCVDMVINYYILIISMFLIFYFYCLSIFDVIKLNTDYKNLRKTTLFCFDLNIKI